MGSQGAVSSNGKPAMVGQGAATNEKPATNGKPAMVNQGVVSKNGKPVTSSSQSNASGTRGMLSRVSESTQTAVGRQRSWSQLMDRNAFDKPASFADAVSRVLKNVRYFRMNYITAALVVIGLSLLSHPVSLAVLVLLVVAWVYLYFGRTEPLIIFNQTFSENQVLFALGIATIAGLFLTKAGSTFTTALIICVVAILLHASFRRPDDLFLDEQENRVSSGYGPILPSSHV